MSTRAWTGALLNQMALDSHSTGSFETMALKSPAHDAFIRNVVRYATVLLVYDVAGLEEGSVLVRPSDLPVQPGDAEALDAVAIAGEVIIEWNAVMLVTALEAYLQDALADAAKRAPSLMMKSEQRATYSEVIAAASTDDLAAGLRQRWARAFMERGGPLKWQERLEKLGARGFHPDTGSALEPLWGLRHLIVHNAGVINDEFIRRYPDYSGRSGQPLKLKREDMKQFVAPLLNFAEAADGVLGAMGR